MIKYKTNVKRHSFDKFIFDRYITINKSLGTFLEFLV